MIRKCEVCGRKIAVTVYADHTYSGGNCFHRAFPEPRRGKKPEESWECEKCWGPHWTYSLVVQI